MLTNDKANMKLCEARIGRKLFSTLDDALQASVSGDIIYLLRDCTYNEKKLIIKEDVKIYIPKGLKLNVGTELTQGVVLHEAALYTKSDDCTYYGSLTDALNAAGDSEVEIYTYGRHIDVISDEPVKVGSNTTFKINRPTELFVQGELIVLGTLIITTTDCVLQVVGTLTVEGTVDVVQVGDYGGVLYVSGNINVIYSGELLVKGGLLGDYELDAAVMLTEKKETYIAQLAFYGRLNDALEAVEPNGILTLLKDTNGYDLVYIPENVTLIVPTGTVLDLETDATLNVEGNLTVEDSCAITGDLMCSLSLGNNVVLNGLGLSANSNFYEGEMQAPAKAGAGYHWSFKKDDFDFEFWLRV